MIFFTGKRTVEYTLKAEMVGTGGDIFFCKTHVDTAGEDTDAAKLINSQGAYCCAKSKKQDTAFGFAEHLTCRNILMFFSRRCKKGVCIATRAKRYIRQNRT